MAMAEVPEASFDDEAAVLVAAPLVVSSWAIEVDVSLVMSSRCAAAELPSARSVLSKTTNALANLCRSPAMPKCRLCSGPPQGLARWRFGRNNPRPCD